MEYLSKLFGSPARVKLLRLFLFNPNSVYDRDSVISLTRVTPDTASRELASLARANIICRKTFYKEIMRAGTKKTTKRKTLGWVLNTRYPHLKALHVFIRDTLALSDSEIKKRIRGVGAVKLVTISGFLIGQENAELDLLIVADRLNDQTLRNAIRVLEAECGREIRYALLTKEEYTYRRRVRDKMMRDIFDFPHREILNKIGAV